MDEKQTNSALPEISRRRVLAAGALGVANLVLPIAVGRATDASGLIYVYVGSYTNYPPGGGSNARNTGSSRRAGPVPPVYEADRLRDTPAPGSNATPRNGQPGQYRASPRCAMTS